MKIYLIGYKVKVLLLQADRDQESGGVPHSVWIVVREKCVLLKIGKF